VVFESSVKPIGQAWLDRGFKYYWLGMQNFSRVLGVKDVGLAMTLLMWLSKPPCLLKIVQAICIQDLDFAQD